MKKKRLFFWKNAPIIMLQIENEYGKVESSFWSDKENLCCYSFQDRGWREELNDDYGKVGEKRKEHVGKW